jgi:hypothetical protein
VGFLLQPLQQVLLLQLVLPLQLVHLVQQLQQEHPQQLALLA